MTALLLLLSQPYQRALSLIDRGEFLKALLVLDSALASDPQDTFLRELKVKALLGSGKPDDALKLAIGLGKEINTKEEFYELFYFFRYSGQEERGMKLLSEARKSLGDPRAFARDFYLFYASRGDMVKALPELFACSLEPALRYWVSDEIRALSRKDPEALSRLSEWMEDNPHPDWLESLCYDMAIRGGFWRIAGRWASGDNEVILVAQKALADGKPDEAMRLLRGVKEREDAYYAISGDCLSAMGRYPEAEASYKAIEDKALREAKLASLYVGAYNQPEKALGLSGGAGDRFTALLRMGRFSDALELASGMNPPDRLYFSGKAGLFMGQEWAQDSLKKFVALYSRDERATEALTWLEICAASGSWPAYFQALSRLEAGRADSVIALSSPDTALAGYFGVLKARALESLGETEKALALYRGIAEGGGLPGAEAAFRAWKLSAKLGRDSDARGFLMILVRKYPMTPYGIIAREYIP
jgi:tetratricopeptide (TPR) repeat protein